MKAREFWIEFAGDPSFDLKGQMRFVTGQQYKSIDPGHETIHVREVLTPDPNDEVIRIAKDAFKDIKDFSRNGNNIQEMTLAALASCYLKAIEALSKIKELEEK